MSRLRDDYRSRLNDRAIRLYDAGGDRDGKGPARLDTARAARLRDARAAVGRSRTMFAERGFAAVSVRMIATSCWERSTTRRAARIASRRFRAGVAIQARSSRRCGTWCRSLLPRSGPRPSAAAVVAPAARCAKGRTPDERAVIVNTLSPLRRRRSSRSHRAADAEAR